MLLGLPATVASQVQQSAEGKPARQGGVLDDPETPWHEREKFHGGQPPGEENPEKANPLPAALVATHTKEACQTGSEPADHATERADIRDKEKDRLAEETANRRQQSQQ